MTTKRKIINTIKVFFILAILGVGFYPTVSDAWNRFVSSKMITNYTESVKSSNTAEISDGIKAAEEYNEKLYKKGANVEDYTEAMNGLSGENGKTFSDKEYESLLNVNSDSIMGYITIPKIDVKLPVYHYTTDDVLSNGIGHLYGSSLPVGGKNTHAVLTGHRGLPKAKLFTDLNLIETGDEFTINVLGQTLTYKVTDINTVLPYDTESLEIQPGKDLVTLVTCTPYGVNTHRLLITGERVETPETTSADTPVQAVQKVFKMPWVIFGIAIFIIIASIVMLIHIWTRPNPTGGKKKENKNETENVN